eukprot:g947.t1
MALTLGVTGYVWVFVFVELNNRKNAWEELYDALAAGEPGDPVGGYYGNEEVETGQEKLGIHSTSVSDIAHVTTGTRQQLDKDPKPPVAAPEQPKSGDMFIIYDQNMSAASLLSQLLGATASEDEKSLWQQLAEATVERDHRRILPLWEFLVFGSRRRRDGFIFELDDDYKQERRTDDSILPEGSGLDFVSLYRTQRDNVSLSRGDPKAGPKTSVQKLEKAILAGEVSEAKSRIDRTKSEKEQIGTRVLWHNEIAEEEKMELLEGDTACVVEQVNFRRKRDDRIAKNEERYEEHNERLKKLLEVKALKRQMELEVDGDSGGAAVVTDQVNATSSKTSRKPKTGTTADDVRDEFEFSSEVVSKADGKVQVFLSPAKAQRDLRKLQTAMSDLAGDVKKDKKPTADVEEDDPPRFPNLVDPTRRLSWATVRKGVRAHEDWKALYRQIEGNVHFKDQASSDLLRFGTSPVRGIEVGWTNEEADEIFDAAEKDELRQEVLSDHGTAFAPPRLNLKVARELKQLTRARKVDGRTFAKLTDMEKAGLMTQNIMGVGDGTVKNEKAPTSTELLKFEVFLDKRLAFLPDEDFVDDDFRTFAAKNKMGRQQQHSSAAFADDVDAGQRSTAAFADLDARGALHAVRKREREAKKKLLSLKKRVYVRNGFGPSAMEVLEGKAAACNLEETCSNLLEGYLSTLASATAASMASKTKGGMSASEVAARKQLLLAGSAGAGSTAAKKARLAMLKYRIAADVQQACFQAPPAAARPAPATLLRLPASGTSTATTAAAGSAPPPPGGRARVVMQGYPSPGNCSDLVLLHRIIQLQFVPVSDTDEWVVINQFLKFDRNFADCARWGNKLILLHAAARVCVYEQRAELLERELDYQPPCTDDEDDSDNSSSAAEGQDDQDRAAGAKGVDGAAGPGGAGGFETFEHLLMRRFVWESGLEQFTNKISARGRAAIGTKEDQVVDDEMKRYSPANDFAYRLAPAFAAGIFDAMHKSGGIDGFVLDSKLKTELVFFVKHYLLTLPASSGMMQQAWLSGLELLCGTSDTNLGLGEKHDMDIASQMDANLLRRVADLLVAGNWWRGSDSTRVDDTTVALAGENPDNLDRDWENVASVERAAISASGAGDNLHRDFRLGRAKPAVQNESIRARLCQLGIAFVLDAVSKNGGLGLSEYEEAVGDTSLPGDAKESGSETAASGTGILAAIRTFFGGLRAKSQQLLDGLVRNIKVLDSEKESFASGMVTLMLDAFAQTGCRRYSGTSAGGQGAGGSGTGVPVAATALMQGDAFSETAFTPEFAQFLCCAARLLCAGVVQQQYGGKNNFELQKIAFSLLAEDVANKTELPDEKSASGKEEKTEGSKVNKPGTAEVAETSAGRRSEPESRSTLSLESLSAEEVFVRFHAGRSKVDAVAAAPAADVAPRGAKANLGAADATSAPPRPPPQQPTEQPHLLDADRVTQTLRSVCRRFPVSLAYGICGYDQMCTLAESRMRLVGGFLRSEEFRTNKFERHVTRYLAARWGRASFSRRTGLSPTDHYRGHLDNFGMSLFRDFAHKKRQKEDLRSVYPFSFFMLRNLMTAWERQVLSEDQDLAAAEEAKAKLKEEKKKEHNKVADNKLAERGARSSAIDKVTLPAVMLLQEFVVPHWVSEKQRRRAEKNKTKKPSYEDYNKYCDPRKPFEVAMLFAIVAWAEKARRTAKKKEVLVAAVMTALDRVIEAVKELIAPLLPAPPPVVQPVVVEAVIPDEPLSWKPYHHETSNGVNIAELLEADDNIHDRKAISSLWVHRELKKASSEGGAAEDGGSKTTAGTSSSSGDYSGGTTGDESQMSSHSGFAAGSAADSKEGGASRRGGDGEESDEGSGIEDEEEESGADSLSQDEEERQRRLRKYPPLTWSRMLGAFVKWLRRLFLFWAQGTRLARRRKQVAFRRWQLRYDGTQINRLLATSVVNRSDDLTDLLASMHRAALRDRKEEDARGRLRTDKDFGMNNPAGRSANHEKPSVLTALVDYLVDDDGANAKANAGGGSSDEGEEEDESDDGSRASDADSDEVSDTAADQEGERAEVLEGEGEGEAEPDEIMVGEDDDDEEGAAGRPSSTDNKVDKAGARGQKMIEAQPSPFEPIYTRIDAELVRISRPECGRRARRPQDVDVKLDQLQPDRDARFVEAVSLVEQDEKLFRGHVTHEAPGAEALASFQAFRACYETKLYNERQLRGVFSSSEVFFREHVALPVLKELFGKWLPQAESRAAKFVFDARRRNKHYAAAMRRPQRRQKMLLQKTKAGGRFEERVLYDPEKPLQVLQDLGLLGEDGVIGGRTESDRDALSDSPTLPPDDDEIASAEARRRLRTEMRLRDIREKILKEKNDRESKIASQGEKFVETEDEAAPTPRHGNSTRVMKMPASMAPAHDHGGKHGDVRRFGTAALGQMNKSSRGGPPRLYYAEPRIRENESVFADLLEGPKEAVQKKLDEQASAALVAGENEWKLSEYTRFAIEQHFGKPVEQLWPGEIVRLEEEPPFVRLKGEEEDKEERERWEVNSFDVRTPSVEEDERMETATIVGAPRQSKFLPPSVAKRILRSLALQDEMRKERTFYDEPVEQKHPALVEDEEDQEEFSEEEEVDTEDEEGGGVEADGGSEEEDEEGKEASGSASDVYADSADLDAESVDEDDEGVWSPDPDQVKAIFAGHKELYGAAIDEALNINEREARTFGPSSTSSAASITTTGRWRPSGRVKKLGGLVGVDFDQECDPEGTVASVGGRFVERCSVAIAIVDTLIYLARHHFLMAKAREIAYDEAVKKLPAEQTAPNKPPPPPDPRKAALVALATRFATQLGLTQQTLEDIVGLGMPTLSAKADEEDTDPLVKAMIARAREKFEEKAALVEQDEDWDSEAEILYDPAQPNGNIRHDHGGEQEDFLPESDAPFQIKLHLPKTPPKTSRVLSTVYFPKAQLQQLAREAALGSSPSVVGVKFLAVCSDGTPMIPLDAQKRLLFPLDLRDGLPIFPTTTTTSTARAGKRSPPAAGPASSAVKEQPHLEYLTPFDPETWRPAVPVHILSQFAITHEKMQVPRLSKFGVMLFPVDLDGVPLPDGRNRLVKTRAKESEDLVADGTLAQLMFEGDYGFFLKAGGGGGGGPGPESSVVGAGAGQLFSQGSGKFLGTAFLAKKGVKGEAPLAPDSPLFDDLFQPLASADGTTASGPLPLLKTGPDALPLRPKKGPHQLSQYIIRERQTRNGTLIQLGRETFGMMENDYREAARLLRTVRVHDPVEEQYKLEKALRKRMRERYCRSRRSFPVPFGGSFACLATDRFALRFSDLVDRMQWFFLGAQAAHKKYEELEALLKQNKGLKVKKPKLDLTKPQLKELEKELKGPDGRYVAYPGFKRWVVKTTIAKTSKNKKSGDETTTTTSAVVALPEELGGGEATMLNVYDSPVLTSREKMRLILGFELDWGRTSTPDAHDDEHEPEDPHDTSAASSVDAFPFVTFSFIEPGSKAAQLKVVVGDVLVAIKGKRVARVAEWPGADNDDRVLRAVLDIDAVLVDMKTKALELTRTTNKGLTNHAARISKTPSAPLRHFNGDPIKVPTICAFRYERYGGHYLQVVAPGLFEKPLGQVLALKRSPSGTPAVKAVRSNSWLEAWNLKEDDQILAVEDVFVGQDVLECHPARRFLFQQALAGKVMDAEAVETVFTSSEVLDEMDRSVTAVYAKAQGTRPIDPRKRDAGLRPWSFLFYRAKGRFPRASRVDGLVGDLGASFFGLARTRRLARELAAKAHAKGKGKKGKLRQPSIKSATHAKHAASAQRKKSASPAAANKPKPKSPPAKGRSPKAVGAKGNVGKNKGKDKKGAPAQSPLAAQQKGKGKASKGKGKKGVPPPIAFFPETDDADFEFRFDGLEGDNQWDPALALAGVGENAADEQVFEAGKEDRGGAMDHVPGSVVLGLESDEATPGDHFFPAFFDDFLHPAEREFVELFGIRLDFSRVPVRVSHTMWEELEDRQDGGDEGRDEGASASESAEDGLRPLRGTSSSSSSSDTRERRNDFRRNFRARKAGVAVGDICIGITIRDADEAGGAKEYSPIEFVEKKIRIKKKGVAARATGDEEVLPPPPKGLSAASLQALVIARLLEEIKAGHDADTDDPSSSGALHDRVKGRSKKIVVGFRFLREKHRERYLHLRFFPSEKRFGFDLFNENTTPAGTPPTISEVFKASPAAVRFVQPGDEIVAAYNPPLSGASRQSSSSDDDNPNAIFTDAFELRRLFSCAPRERIKHRGGKKKEPSLRPELLQPEIESVTDVLLFRPEGFPTWAREKAVILENPFRVLAARAGLEFIETGMSTPSKDDQEIELEFLGLLPPRAADKPFGDEEDSDTAGALPNIREAEQVQQNNGAAAAGGAPPKTSAAAAEAEQSGGFFDGFVVAANNYDSSSAGDDEELKATTKARVFKRIWNSERSRRRRARDNNENSGAGAASGSAAATAEVEVDEDEDDGYSARDEDTASATQSGPVGPGEDEDIAAISVVDDNYSSLSDSDHGATAERTPKRFLWRRGGEEGRTGSETSDILEDRIRGDGVEDSRREGILSSEEDGSSTSEGGRRKNHDGKITSSSEDTATSEEERRIDTRLKAMGENNAERMRLRKQIGKLRAELPMLQKRLEVKEVELREVLRSLESVETDTQETALAKEERRVRLKKKIIPGLKKELRKKQAALLGCENELAQLRQIVLEEQLELKEQAHALMEAEARASERKRKRLLRTPGRKSSKDDADESEMEEAEDVEEAVTEATNDLASALLQNDLVRQILPREHRKKLEILLGNVLAATSRGGRDVLDVEAGAAAEDADDGEAEQGNDTTLKTNVDRPQHLDDMSLALNLTIEDQGGVDEVRAWEKVKLEAHSEQRDRLRSAVYDRIAFFTKASQLHKLLSLERETIVSDVKARRAYVAETETRRWIKLRNAGKYQSAESDALDLEKAENEDEKLQALLQKLSAKDAEFEQLEEKVLEAINRRAADHEEDAEDDEAGEDDENEELKLLHQSDMESALLLTLAFGDADAGEHQNQKENREGTTSEGAEDVASPTTALGLRLLRKLEERKLRRAFKTIDYVDPVYRGGLENNRDMQKQHKKIKRELKLEALKEEKLVEMRNARIPGGFILDLFEPDLEQAANTMIDETVRPAKLTKEDKKEVKREQKLAKAEMHKKIEDNMIFLGENAQFVGGLIERTAQKAAAPARKKLDQRMAEVNGLARLVEASPANKLARKELGVSLRLGEKQKKKTKSKSPGAGPTDVEDGKKDAMKIAHPQGGRLPMPKRKMPALADRFRKEKASKKKGKSSSSSSSSSEQGKSSSSETSADAPNSGR